MRPKVHLSYLFCSLILSSCFTTKSKDIYYYNSSLSLILLKDGISQFIQISRDKSEQDYENALNDIILLADKNQTNITELLQNIHKELDQRIKKINYLKDKKIDREVLAVGLGFIGLGIGLSYATYYTYRYYYRVNRNEHSTIKKYLESRGVFVNADFGNVRLCVPAGTSYYTQAQQLLKLNKAENELTNLLILESVFQSVAYFYGIFATLAGFDPHMNDKYLEKYQNMVAITKKLQENNSLKKLP